MKASARAAGTIVLWHPSGKNYASTTAWVRRAASAHALLRFDARQGHRLDLIEDPAQRRLAERARPDDGTGATATIRPFLIDALEQPDFAHGESDDLFIGDGWPSKAGSLPRWIPWSAMRSPPAPLALGSRCDCSRTLGQPRQASACSTRRQAGHDPSL